MSVTKGRDKMFSRIHHKLGTAGLVIAIMALILALGGAAYAALPGLNAKQKKEVKKIAKKLVAPGVQGPAGPAGVKGDTGVKGDNGANGDTGLQGPPGPTDVKAPFGKTMKGFWDFQVNNSFHEGILSITFPLRVEPVPDYIFMPPNADPTDECPGEAQDPKAKRGYFCLYAEVNTGTIDKPTTGTFNSSGWQARWSTEPAAPTVLAFGSWAVTKRCPLDEEEHEIPC